MTSAKSAKSKAKSLYDVLELADSKASQSQIKKQYYNLALRYHPDKSSDDNAESLFKEISHAYSILSDVRKRQIYDETGSVDGEEFTEEVDSWRKYFESMFSRVTVADLEKFEREFKGSQEERDDLIRAYHDSQGDMNVIMESVMLASCEDEDRFVEILKAEDIKYPAFKRTCTKKQRDQRKRTADQEAVEAEELAQELGIKPKSLVGAGDDQLVALIQARAQKRSADGFLDGLAEKYAPKRKDKKKNKS